MSFAAYQSPSPTDAEENLDRDALHVLPLKAFPIETKGLQNAKLVKNARLETMVELFKEKGSGSGQVAVKSLYEVFPKEGEGLKRDIEKLQSIALLSSFDVYSLRIDLRRLGVNVEDTRELSLSKEKKDQLTRPMQAFISPLIQRVYGINPQQSENVRAVIVNPDSGDTLSGLEKLADELDISVLDIPELFAEFGDIYLSLVYFKQELADIMPQINRFLQTIATVKDSMLIKQDNNTLKIFNQVESLFSEVIRSLSECLDAYQDEFEHLWDNVTAQSFKAARERVMATQSEIGGVLCALAVKMRLYEERFPGTDPAPAKFAEFLRSDVYTGLNKIQALQVKLDKKNKRK